MFPKYDNLKDYVYFLYPRTTAEELKTSNYVPFYSNGYLIEKVWRKNYKDGVGKKTFIAAWDGCNLKRVSFFGLDNERN